MAVSAPRACQSLDIQSNITVRAGARFADFWNLFGRAGTEENQLPGLHLTAAKRYTQGMALVFRIAALSRRSVP
jgi:hypothetical protein